MIPVNVSVRKGSTSGEIVNYQDDYRLELDRWENDGGRSV